MEVVESDLVITFGEEKKKRIRLKLAETLSLDFLFEGGGKEKGMIGGSCLIGFLLTSPTSLQYHSLRMRTIHFRLFERWHCADV